MSPPRLAIGIEVVQLADGVVIVNAGPPALFQGRGASEVMVPLLRELDGSLSAHGLAIGLGLVEAHVVRAIELLAERGLLEPDE